MFVVPSEVLEFVFSAGFGFVAGAAVFAFACKSAPSPWFGLARSPGFESEIPFGGAEDPGAESAGTRSEADGLPSVFGGAALVDAASVSAKLAPGGTLVERVGVAARVASGMASIATSIRAP